MFRIRRIYDNLIPLNKSAIIQVQAILRAQFPFIKEEEIMKLPEKLRNPFQHGFRSILFVADDFKSRVKGFALILHDPDLNFCYLDYISAAKKLIGRGVGGALYERIRQEAQGLNCIGLFFECLPDDPMLSKDPVIRKQNEARLRFYEPFGARPISNTKYETPVKPGGDNPPYLVFDSLGKSQLPTKEEAQTIVRSILERKYHKICPKEYIEMVVQSFTKSPIQLREPRYLKVTTPIVSQPVVSIDQKIVLVITDRHEIHHIRERGYVESPIRIKNILSEIELTDLFVKKKIEKFSDKNIRAIHDNRFINYLKTVCRHIPPGDSVYPYVFPIRNTARPPIELAVRAGYYCIDTFTPLNRHVYEAAKGAIDCALTAANSILEGAHLAYALVRPPGHHAEWNNFGGFCYFNSNAAAAQFLSRFGRVAILDIDYHHGNGQQDIFYQRSDVLTISIHGHPSFAYPYFSGFEDEKGFGIGKGMNVNYPLPERIDSSKYREILLKALNKIKRFNADFLVVALGLDTAKGDPTGSWLLNAKDFEKNGLMIGSLKLPTLVVQEGGYNQKNIGINARNFFMGLWKGFFQ
jgi:acetoin utilization deacetylase AcuC-like enzyme/GNAT superfamily N-acetyltransferase